MKKLTLRMKLRIFLGLYTLGVVMALVALVTGVFGLMVASACIIVLSTVVMLVWYRCPYCGRLLQHHRDGDYCQGCGQRVFFDNHDDFQDLEEN